MPRTLLTSALLVISFALHARGAEAGALESVRKGKKATGLVVLPA